jgi:hypothetical protein
MSSTDEEIAKKGGAAAVPSSLKVKSGIDEATRAKNEHHATCGVVRLG